MTKSEANAEAVRRWGKKKGYAALVGRHYTVGEVGGVFGTGDSWEAAFADADKRGIEYRSITIQGIEDMDIGTASIVVKAVEGSNIVRIEIHACNTVKVLSMHSESAFQLANEIGKAWMHSIYHPFTFIP